MTSSSWVFVPCHHAAVSTLSLISHRSRVPVPQTKPTTPSISQVVFLLLLVELLLHTARPTPAYSSSCMRVSSGALRTHVAQALVIMHQLKRNRQRSTLNNTRNTPIPKRMIPQTHLPSPFIRKTEAHEEYDSSPNCPHSPTAHTNERLPVYALSCPHKLTRRLPTTMLDVGDPGSYSKHTPSHNADITNRLVTSPSVSSCQNAS